MQRGSRQIKRPATANPASEDAAEIIKRLKTGKGNTESYREKSLKLHGWICAKCGREFELKNLHQLTVHHKDGNHNNNPADGSNWENLCIYCHDDEHSRSMLGDYLTGKK
jgi:hypothetical protein